MEARGPAAASHRSTFVTVVAWIFIVLTGFTTLMALLQNIMFATVMPFDAMHADAPGETGLPAFIAFMFSHMRALLLAFLLLCAASLAAAIGLLRRKEWARLTFIAMLVLGIAWNLGGLALQYWMFSSGATGAPDASAEFRDQFERVAHTMLAISAAFALGFSVLFGWIAGKLMSTRIRAEFQTS